MKRFMIAGISFWPELWKAKKNTNRLVKILEDVREAGANVVATPEGILDGYVCKEAEKRKISEKYRGSKDYRKRLAQFKAKERSLARKIRQVYLPVVCQKVSSLGLHLFLNTLDIRDDNDVFNTTFYIGPDGLIRGKYDKVHADFEVGIRLGKGYVVFRTPYSNIAVLICADRQFPEPARCLALDGAHLLIINSHGLYGEGANERFIRQRAYENGLFVLFCHPGESVIVSPEGRIIGATCSWESFVVRLIDPEESVGRGLFGSSAMAKTYSAISDFRKYQRCKAEIQKRNRK